MSRNQIFLARSKFLKNCCGPNFGFQNLWPREIWFYGQKTKIGLRNTKSSFQNAFSSSKSPKFVQNFSYKIFYFLLGRSTRNHYTAFSIFHRINAECRWRNLKSNFELIMALRASARRKITEIDVETDQNVTKSNFFGAIKFSEKFVADLILDFKIFDHTKLNSMVQKFINAKIALQITKSVLQTPQSSLKTSKIAQISAIFFFSRFLLCYENDTAL